MKTVEDNNSNNKNNEVMGHNNGMHTLYSVVYQRIMQYQVLIIAVYDMPVRYGSICFASLSVVFRNP